MRALLAFSTLAVLLGTACSPTGEIASDSSTETPPADLVVLFGRHGVGGSGVAGYTIRADGTVLRWEGIAPESTVLAEGRVGADRVQALWDHLRAVGFWERQQQAMNPTHFITATANGESRRVTWHAPIGAAPPDTDVQRLYDDFDGVARSAFAAPE